jgi:type II secretion system protein G
MKRGFTIVEIIVVIGIIALLTAVILPSLTNIKKKNKDTERISDISAIQLALSVYRSKMGEYPTSTDPLTVPAEALVPPEGGTYMYVPLKKTGTKCTYYHLGAKLELANEQVDKNDKVVSATTTPMYTPTRSLVPPYTYCDSYSGPGIDGTDLLIYDVYPQ